MTPACSMFVCAAAVLALLAAEYLGSQPGKWLSKPLASMAFVATAVESGALDSSYGRWLLLGLLLSLLGDVLLLPAHRPRIFRGGVFAFLAAHVAYIAAFLTQPVNLVGTLVAGGMLAFALRAAWRWLRRTLTADLRAAVASYFVVIGTMATLACGMVPAGAPVTVALAALMFAASDLAVARDRFVREDFWNRAWGLPLYYGAQLLLARSIAALS